MPRNSNFSTWRNLYGCVVLDPSTSHGFSFDFCSFDFFLKIFFLFLYLEIVLVPSIAKLSPSLSLRFYCIRWTVWTVVCLKFNKNFKLFSLWPFPINLFHEAAQKFWKTNLLKVIVLPWERFLSYSRMNLIHYFYDPKKKGSRLTTRTLLYNWKKYRSKE